MGLRVLLRPPLCLWVLLCLLCVFASHGEEDDDGVDGSCSVRSPTPQGLLTSTYTSTQSWSPCSTVPPHSVRAAYKTSHHTLISWELIQHISAAFTQWHRNRVTPYQSATFWQFIVRQSRQTRVLNLIILY